MNCGDRSVCNTYPILVYLATELQFECEPLRKHLQLTWSTMMAESYYMHLTVSGGRLFFSFLLVLLFFFFPFPKQYNL